VFYTTFRHINQNDGGKMIVKCVPCGGTGKQRSSQDEIKQCIRCEGIGRVRSGRHGADVVVLGFAQTKSAVNEEWLVIDCVTGTMTITAPPGLFYESDEHILSFLQKTSRFAEMAEAHNWLVRR
jgi:hypothetical protein